MVLPPSSVLLPPSSVLLPPCSVLHPSSIPPSSLRPPSLTTHMIEDHMRGSAKHTPRPQAPLLPTPPRNTPPQKVSSKTPETPLVEKGSPVRDLQLTWGTAAETQQAARTEYPTARGRAAGSCDREIRRRLGSTVRFVPHSCGFASLCRSSFAPDVVQIASF
jgi:hypothetical protein